MKAQRELGEKFEIREFHDAVLEHGAIPLSVLETKINEWIIMTKNIEKMNDDDANIHNFLTPFPMSIPRWKRGSITLLCDQYSGSQCPGNKRNH